jgi:mannose/fructose/N-acetylgalactosamine-specific phosphotransferase system component IIB
VKPPSLPLLRIDDRLLHGQVLVAWAAALRPARIVLASDAVAADPVRRALYLGLPRDEFEIDVLGCAAAAVELAPGRRVLAVCASPADALKVVEAGAAIEAVQIGGLHASAGKTQVLDYVHVSAADTQALVGLLQRGIVLEARDLPGHRGVRLDAAALERVAHGG